LTISALINGEKFKTFTQIQYQQPSAQPRPKKPVFKLQQEEENPEEEYDVRENL
jgi:hypothetical protein